MSTSNLLAGVRAGRRPRTNDHYVRGEPRRVWRGLVAWLLLVGCACAAEARDAPEDPGAPRELRFESAGVTLVGTLFPPPGDEPLRGTMVIGHGSAPTTRDDLGFYIDLVRELGFAAFAFDKRGCGASGGEFPRFEVARSDERFRLLAGDMAAAVAAVRRVPELGALPVGLVGGSQAGWIMPLAAVEFDASPAFVISVCGAAVSAGEEARHGELSGETQRENESPDELRARMHTADEALRGFDGERGFDPRPVLARLRAPLLWIAGGLDPVVPTQPSLEVLRTLRDEADLPVRIVLFETMDHNTRDVVNETWCDLTPAVRSWMEELPALQR